MKLKSIVSSLFFMSITFSIFSQVENDSMKNCQVDRFRDVSNQFEKVFIKKKVFLYVNTILIDYYKYNSKNQLIKENGRKFKFYNDSLLSKFEISLTNKNYDKLIKEGYSVDSILQDKKSYNFAPILFGIGLYENEKKVGTWYYYNSVTLEKYAEANYSAGKLNGFLKLYSKGKINAKINYVNNCQHGYFIYYFSNGRIAEFGENRFDAPFEFIKYKRNGKTMFIYKSE